MKTMIELLRNQLWCTKPGLLAQISPDGLGLPNLCRVTPPPSVGLLENGTVFLYIHF